MLLVTAFILSCAAIICPSDILTVQELAERLKVDKGWVYEKMRPRQANPLPSIRMGRYRRFFWTSVCSWLQLQERNAPEPPAESRKKVAK